MFSLPAGLLLILSAPLRAANVSAVRTEPQGAEVEASAVAVTFDRPMAVRVGTAAACIELEPRAEGRCAWVDFDRLVFRPASPLPGATRFSARVRAGLRSEITGETLDSDVAWTFETPRLRVLKTWPEDGAAWVPSTAAILVAFNLPMDASRAAVAMRLIKYPEASQESFALRRPTPEEMARLGSDSASIVLAAAPTRPLERERSYALVLDAGLKPALGELGLPRETRLRWEAPYAFRFLGAEPAERFCLPARLSLAFSDPPDPSDLRSRLRVSSAATGNLRFVERRDPEARRVWIDVEGLELSTGTVAAGRIEPGLKDSFGATLGEARFEWPAGGFCPSARLVSSATIETESEARVSAELTNVSGGRLRLTRIKPDELVPALRRLAEERDGGAPYRSPDVDVALRASAAPDAPERRILDIGGVLGDAGGAVLIELEPAALPEERRIISVTKTALSLELGPASGLARSSFIKTGAPQPDVALQLRDRTNRVLWSGTTNAGGLARTPGLRALGGAAEDGVWLLARKKDDFAFLSSAPRTSSEAAPGDGLVQARAEPPPIAQGASVSSPAILSPLLPAFARVGDAFRGGLRLRNDSIEESSGTLIASWSGDAAAAFGEESRSFSLKPGEARDFPWDLTALATGQLRLAARATASSRTFDASATLDIRRALPPEQPCVFFAASGPASFPIESPPGTESLELRLSARPDLVPAARALLAAEDSTLPSRLGALIPFLARVGGDGAARSAAQAALAALPAYQRDEGGYGLWREASRPAPLWTAETLRLLALVRARGLAFDEPAARRALDRLRENLNAAPAEGTTFQEDALSRAAAVRALAAWGRRDDSSMNRLWALKDLLPLQALSELTGALSSLGDRRKNEAAGAVLAKLALEGAAARTRSIARALEVLVEAGAPAADRESAAEALMSRRSDGRWADGPENGAAVLALARHFESLGPPSISARTRFAGAEWSLAPGESDAARTFGPEISMFAFPRLELESAGTARVSACWRLTPLAKPPLSEGLRIDRAPGPERFQAGREYELAVAASAPAALTGVNIEAPLPAGFVPIDSPAPPGARVELRADRVVFLVERLAAGETRFAYRVRAATPGLFRRPPPSAFSLGEGARARGEADKVEILP